MELLSVNLFGRLEFTVNGTRVDGLIKAGKALELFCYLLINYNEPHTREKLAVVLWNDASAKQSKQYLRTALWQLHSGLTKQGIHVIASDSAWLQVVATPSLWADTIYFEETFKSTRNVKPAGIYGSLAKEMKLAVSLYRGNLLEGWYQDWCIIVRERFQNMYMTLLEKLLLICQITGNYAEGIEYGLNLLGVDNAHERTHRRLMRLYYLDGDRTSALRQYQRCEAILKSEFQTKPSARTRLLFEQIKEDRTPELLGQA